MWQGKGGLRLLFFISYDDVRHIIYDPRRPGQSAAQRRAGTLLHSVII